MHNANMGVPAGVGAGPPDIAVGAPTMRLCRAHVGFLKLFDDFPYKQKKGTMPICELGGHALLLHLRRQVLRLSSGPRSGDGGGAWFYSYLCQDLDRALTRYASVVTV